MDKIPRAGTPLQRSVSQGQIGGANRRPTSAGSGHGRGGQNRTSPAGQASTTDIARAAPACTGVVTPTVVRNRVNGAGSGSVIVTERSVQPAGDCVLGCGVVAPHAMKNGAASSPTPLTSTVCQVRRTPSRRARAPSRISDGANPAR